MPTLAELAAALAVPRPADAFWPWLLDPQWQAAIGLQLQDATASQQAQVRNALARLWRDVAERPADIDATVRRFEGDLKRIFHGVYDTTSTRLRDLVRQRASTWRGTLPGSIFTDLEMPTPPLVLWHAEQHAARLVRHVSDGTRASLSTLTRQALEAGDNPLQLARRLRRGLPLLPQQQAAVARLEGNALEGGASPTQARRIADRQARVYAAHRAETIARTEMLGASNRAIRETWRDRQRDGWLLPTAQMVWVATTRDCQTCPTCREVAGQLVPIGGQFAVPGARGGTVLVDGPPTHPRCRCTTSVIADRVMFSDAEWERVTNPQFPDC